MLENATSLRLGFISCGLIPFNFSILSSYLVIHFPRRIIQSQTPLGMENLHLHLRHSKSKDEVEDTNSETYRAAESFAQSFANAMSLGSKDIELEQIAAKLADHYSPQSFTAFSLGYVTTVEGPTAKNAIQQHLERFENSGLGVDITMESLRVEVVSKWSALCWITWRIHPKESSTVKEGWTWQNVYGYRKPKWEGQEKGFWEFSVSDNETESIVRRIPDFLEL